MSKRLRFVVAATLAVGLFSHVAAAAEEDKSGITWLRKCTNPEPNWLIECAVYVRAVVDYDEVRARELGQKRFICLTDGVTLGQTRQIVIKSLREKPQDLHRPFALLAHRALEAAFPCAGALQ